MMLIRLYKAVCTRIWVFCRCSKFYCNKCGGPPNVPGKRGPWSKKCENYTIWWRSDRWCNYINLLFTKNW